MAFKAARCPSCSGELMLDPEKKSGFCNHCGSEIIVEEAINKVRIEGAVRIDKDAEIINYLSLAKNAIESDCGIEALVYCDKVLEIDSSQREAWLLKIDAYILEVSNEVTYAKELINSSKNSLIGINATEKEKLVSEIALKLLRHADNLMDRAIFILSDKDAIKNMYEALVLANMLSASNSTDTLQIDLPTLASAEILKKDSIDLAIYARKLTIENDATINESIFALADKYIQATKFLKERLSSYGVEIDNVTVTTADSKMERAFSSWTIEDRVKKIELLLQGFPEEKVNTTLEKFKPISQSSGGCYIATAVYEDYNAPEVKVLREYRDSVLNKTKFGRGLIRVYYQLSPSISRRLKNKHWLRSKIKVILNLIVNRIN